MEPIRDSPRRMHQILRIMLLPFSQFGGNQAPDSPIWNSHNTNGYGYPSVSLASRMPERFLKMLMSMSLEMLVVAPSAIQN